MKKKLLVFMISLLSIFGFAANVKADTPPSSFRTWKVVLLNEYIPGVKIYHKPLENGVEVYCEDFGLKYDSLITMNLLGKVNDGYIYIHENRPNTGNAELDYYITSVAVWWYKDILNNNNANISAATKNYIISNKDSNSICKLVYNLVEGAKNYKQTNGYINFTDDKINFTESNGYYISDKIYVSSKVNTFSGVKVTGAPANTTVINKNINNANGYFQLQVPKASLKENESVNITVSATGTYNIKSMYDYKYSDVRYQKVIYGKVYTTSYNVSDSKVITVTRGADPHNKLNISKVDKNSNFVNGAELTLYKGNCVSAQCSSSNIYSSWTTTSSVKVFNDIPVGYYTLVETKTPSGYRTAQKMLINVASNNGSYSYSLVNYELGKVKISKTDVTGQNEIPGAKLVLKTESGSIVKEWISTTEAQYVELTPGVYTLTETIAPNGYILNRSSITFKVDDNNIVYEKNANGDYVKVDYIKMVNYAKSAINISKLNSETNEFVSGANLIIKNIKGEKVASWTTTNESYYINLDEGEYTLSEEVAPSGYVLNTTSINFKVDADGILYIESDNGDYIKANGIIMYNDPIPEIIEIPSTGLSSTLTYVIGALIISVGAIVLYKNEKKC